MTGVKNYMNIEKAYYRLFNRITDLCALIEDKREGETINIVRLLRSFQSECEKICISDEENQ